VGEGSASYPKNIFGVRVRALVYECFLDNNTYVRNIIITVAVKSLYVRGSNVPSGWIRIENRIPVPGIRRNEYYTISGRQPVVREKI
jgi:hypothetical protein